MASNQFPKFTDGEVTIHFSEDDQPYVLHSFVLALHSPYFKSVLSERWAKNNAETSQNSGKPHWIFELRFDKDSDIGMLGRQGVESDTVHLKHTREFPEDEDDEDDDYDWHTQWERMQVVQAHRDLFGMLEVAILSLPHDRKYKYADIFGI